MKTKIFIAFIIFFILFSTNAFASSTVSMTSNTVYKITSDDTSILNSPWYIVDFQKSSCSIGDPCGGESNLTIFDTNLPDSDTYPLRPLNGSVEGDIASANSTLIESGPVRVMIAFENRTGNLLAGTTQVNFTENIYAYPRFYQVYYIFTFNSSFQMGGDAITEQFALYTPTATAADNPPFDEWNNRTINGTNYLFSVDVAKGADNHILGYVNTTVAFVFDDADHNKTILYRATQTNFSGASMPVSRISQGTDEVEKIGFYIITPQAASTRDFGYLVMFGANGKQAVTANGTVWNLDFNEQYLAWHNPATITAIAGTSQNRDNISGSYNYTANASYIADFNFTTIGANNYTYPVFHLMNVSNVSNVINYVYWKNYTASSNWVQLTNYTDFVIQEGNSSYFGYPYILLLINKTLGRETVSTETYEFWISNSTEPTPTPPTYSLNSTNSTISGTPIQFDLYWQDNVGLSQAITSLWNGSSWVNASSWCSLSGTSAWCNQTLVVNETSQQLWWKQYANDTASPANWNISENFSLVITQTYYSNVTQSITFADSSSKIIKFVRNPTQSLTLTAPTIKIGNFFKSLTQPFTLTAPVERIRSALKAFSEYFLLNVIASRVYASLKSISTPISFTILVSRISSLIKTLSQSFIASNIASKSLLFVQTTSQSFNINVATSRLITFTNLISQSLTFSTAISRLQNFIRSLSQAITTNDVTSRLATIYKSLSQSITANAVTGRMLTAIKDVLQSFTTNAISTRISEFSRITTQPFTISTLSSRGSELYRTISGSFLITESSSRIRSVLTSVSQFFSTSISTSRLYSSLRSITSYFTTTFAISNVPIRITSMSQSLSLTAVSSRLSSLSRLITDYFSITSVSARISTLYKSITSYFTLSETTTRTQYLVKSLSQFLTLNTISTRISTIFKTVSDSFTANTITSRFIGFYKPITQLFNLELIATRSQILFKIITQSISTILTIIRTKLGVNEEFISLSLSITDSTTRLLNIYKALSQSFITNALITKTRALIQSLLQSLNITDSSSRLINTYKLISQALTANIITGRMLTAIKSISDSFIFSSITSRGLIFIKSPSDSLSISIVTVRVINIYKSLADSFILTESSTRIISLNRIIGEAIPLNLIAARFNILTTTTATSFSLTSITTRILTFSRTFSQGITITRMMTRTQSLIRIFSQQFSTIATAIGIKPGVSNQAITSLSLTLSSSIQRTLSITRTISQSLYVNVAFTRLLSLTRIFTQSLSLYALGFRQFLCSWFNGDSGSCSAAGCYYCSGTCQATTCPSPSQPSGGGGGGFWISPAPTNVTNVTPEIVVLDTSINMEINEVIPGDRVYATTTIQKISVPQRLVNVNLSYWITDPDGRILGSKSTAVGVEVLRKDIYFIIVPIDAPLGTYKFEVLAQYDNATDVSYSTFDVVSSLPEIPLIINSIDVPIFLQGASFSIKISLENKLDSQLPINVTLLLPYEFELLNITKSATLEPSAEYIFDFKVIPNAAGSFSGFIKIEYEGRKLVKDFNIEVYSPEQFYIYWIRIYWWLILSIIITLILSITVFLKTFKKKEKVKHVYKKI
jgi:hypothetical protein